MIEKGNAEEESEEHLHEECGVVGIYSMGEINTAAAYFALHALQHRGQESAGIVASNGKALVCHKDKGLVREVFEPSDLEPFQNQRISIGHVRYSTQGSNTRFNAQPLMSRYRNGELAVAHNGTLLNTKVLMRDLCNAGSVFQTSTDSEVFVHLLARYAHLSLPHAVLTMMNDVQGSYSLVIITPDTLIGVRDPMGIRPLALGRKGESYMLASESVAFDAVDASYVRDIEPGEIIVINKEGVNSYKYDPHGPKEPSHMCLFEYVYLARTDSFMDGIDIMGARLRAGAELARIAPVEADLVAGVPDSALTAAMGYARESGIPYGDALTKNRYVGRSFIQPEQSMRELAVRMKLNALRANVAGKRVVLVDDSIVRGTTSRKLVDMLKSAGAKEVHLRISSPPVTDPCYFGIDTPSKKQLVGASHTVEATRKLVGADTLAYLPLENLERVVRQDKNIGFCTGCFNGKYPCDVNACKRKGLSGRS